MQDASQNNKETFEYVLAYQDRESKRIQIFLYSIMFLDCYVLISILEGKSYVTGQAWISLIFIASLMCAILSFYCWYRQEMRMAERVDETKSIHSVTSMFEKVLHWCAFISMGIAVNLALIGILLVFNALCSCMLIVLLVILNMAVICAHSYGHFDRESRNRNRQSSDKCYMHCDKSPCAPCEAL